MENKPDFHIIWLTKCRLSSGSIRTYALNELYSLVLSCPSLSLRFSSHIRVSKLPTSQRRWPNRIKITTRPSFSEDTWEWTRTNVGDPGITSGLMTLAWKRTWATTSSWKSGKRTREKNDGFWNRFCSSPATAVMAVAGLLKIFVYQFNSSRLFLMKSLKTASTTGTETELPNCL